MIPSAPYEQWPFLGQNLAKIYSFDQKPIFNQSKVKNFKFEDHE